MSARESGKKRPKGLAAQRPYLWLVHGSATRAKDMSVTDTEDEDESRLMAACRRLAAHCARQQIKFDIATDYHAGW